MTNNPTIDGVSRWLIEQSATFLEAHSSQPSIESNLAADLRALLGADHTGDSNAMVAPALERQDEVQMASMPVERCYDVRAKMIIAFNEAKKAGGDLDDALDAAYRSALRFSPVPQDFADRQSTIVQLEDKLNKAINLDFQRRETIEQLQALIADLESGRGEPVAWMFKYLSHSDSPPYRSFEVTDFHQNQKAPGIAQHTPLYTAPPAPVATEDSEQALFERHEAWMAGEKHGLASLRLPEEDNSDCDYGSYSEGRKHGWNACLDATAALNGPAK